MFTPQEVKSHVRKIREAGTSKAITAGMVRESREARKFAAKITAKFNAEALREALSESEN